LPAPVSLSAPCDMAAVLQTTEKHSGATAAQLYTALYVREMILAYMAWVTTLLATQKVLMGGMRAFYCLLQVVGRGRSPVPDVLDHRAVHLCCFDRLHHTHAPQRITKGIRVMEHQQRCDEAVNYRIGPVTVW
jgi:hypothetical protein